MPACGNREGTPLFKAPLANGVPETFVIYTDGPATVSRLCYSFAVNDPSAFPALAPCTTVGRALNGPLRLKSGQLVWLAEPSGLSNSGPNPCYVPFG